MTENTLKKLAQLLEQDQFELIFSEKIQKEDLTSTRYNKDSPTSIGGEMNCKQENERQWWAERNRYPPLT